MLTMFSQSPKGQWVSWARTIGGKFEGGRSGMGRVGESNGEKIGTL